MNVIYLDNHILVVDKPAGQPIQEDRSGDPDLAREAKRFLADKFDKPGNVFVGLVHRLDRPVSGVVVLARTSKAASRLSEQFRNRAVSKEYVALVEGRVTEGRTLISYLRKQGSKVHPVKQGASGAKRAELRYEPAAVYRRESLVRVVPLTGRPHQIRVQLARDGFPIVGDLKYGATREFDGRNLALHSHKLTFTHPVRKESLTFTAPLPASWPEPARTLLSER